MTDSWLVSSMQDCDASLPLLAPSADSKKWVSEEEATMWDIQMSDSETTSNSSEYEDDEYISAESTARQPKSSIRRRKSRVGKAESSNKELRQPDVSQSSEHVSQHQLDDDTITCGISTPLLLKPRGIEACLDITALGKLWQLLDTWYLYKGRSKRPPCAVEQHRLDELCFIGTRENTCRYLDRQGAELSVTSCPLKGWEDQDLHIIVAFGDKQDAAIIKGRGKSEKKKGKDAGLATFPFYIWKGIAGDDEGWERDSSISKIVRYSNPRFYEPVNMKRRSLQTPRSSLSVGSGPDTCRLVDSIQTTQPLLSETFPELYGRLREWVRIDPARKDLPFVVKGQPDIYYSKTHPEKQIKYVDIDGIPVDAGLFWIGIGNQHVIAAHGSTLEPAIISFDTYPGLPKHYTAYYRWTSIKSWIKRPCVFKVFGDGPYEVPRKYVERKEQAEHQSQVHPLAKGSNLPEKALLRSDVPTALPSTSPVPTNEAPSSDAHRRHKIQKFHNNESQKGADASRQGEQLFSPDLNAEQSSTGNQRQPILISDNPVPTKREGSISWHAKIASEPERKSVAFSLPANDPQPPTQPSNPPSNAKSSMHIAPDSERLLSTFTSEATQPPLEPEGTTTSVMKSNGTGIDGAALDSHIIQNTTLLFFKDNISPPRNRSLGIIQSKSGRECLELLFEHATAGQLFSNQKVSKKLLKLTIAGVEDDCFVMLREEEYYDQFKELLRGSPCWSEGEQGIEGQCVVKVRPHVLGT